MHRDMDLDNFSFIVDIVVLVENCAKKIFVLLKWSKETVCVLYACRCVVGVGRRFDCPQTLSIAYCNIVFQSTYCT
jgi:hypothetical protein